MTTIHTILNQMHSVSTSEADKGTRFEALIRLYLLKDRLYEGQFSSVWRWMNWPGREGKANTTIQKAHSKTIS